MSASAIGSSACEPPAISVEVVLYDLYRDGYRGAPTQPHPGCCRAALGNAAEKFDCDSVILCTARRVERPRSIAAS